MTHPAFPPTAARMTILLENGQFGWSENVFCLLGSPTALLSTIFDQVIAFANTRMTLATANVQLLGVRLSHPINFRDVRFLAPRYYNMYLNGTFGGQAAPAPSSATMLALLFRLEAGELNRRVYDLRGLPAAVLGSTGQYAPVGAPGFSNAVSSFLKLFVPTTGTSPFQLLVRDTSQQLQGITSYTTASSSYQLSIQTLAQLIITPPSGPTRGVATADYVVIRGIKGGTRVNGVWVVYSASSGPPWTYVLGPAKKPISIGSGVNYPSQSVQALVFKLQAVDVAETERISARRTGRPFGQPVGRRAAR